MMLTPQACPKQASNHGEPLLVRANPTVADLSPATRGFPNESARLKFLPKIADGRPAGAVAVVEDQPAAAIAANTRPASQILEPDERVRCFRMSFISFVLLPTIADVRKTARGHPDP